MCSVQNISDDGLYLSFIAASDLSAVPKFYLPRASGGYSEPIYIQVGFPFGNTTSVVHSVVYVSNTADKYVWYFTIAMISRLAQMDCFPLEVSHQQNLIQ